MVELIEAGAEPLQRPDRGAAHQAAGRRARAAARLGGLGDGVTVLAMSDARRLRGPHARRPHRRLDAPDRHDRADRPARGRRAALEIASGIVFVLGNLIGGFSPFARDRDVDRPASAGPTARPAMWSGRSSPPRGILIVFAAQMGMGSSWRIGVSDDQDTDLITGGFFADHPQPDLHRHVRHLDRLLPHGPDRRRDRRRSDGRRSDSRARSAWSRSRSCAAPMPAYADYERRVGRFLPGVGRARRALRV